ncbi:protein-glutamate methylesterase/protein-glutamine glutaminase [Alkalicoccus daliensis]|uniref:Protein-glutamate methylesterase/protein-glutamine glutaminase n=1 Tax=Alkalicoccus daliensis TaxID=745820 RepID=A0A1H0A5F3_9BACI|nr:chemotaxis response regulator protein-glutamate methylesterase [Alkalicoccus daliensis]SDN28685.1 two-component system, chemotaxis family, response regulator CheB [Alkalicoccus daliensis]
MNSPIKVLVVDDSAFMRKMIAEMLSAEKDILVVDKARNGQEAVEKTKMLKPDVITLDVEMPVMSGLDALKIIMRESPTKVIMVSSITKSGAEATIKAMEFGAFDFISKPSGSISLDIDKVKNHLIKLVRLAGSVKTNKITNRKTEVPMLARTSIKSDNQGSAAEMVVAVGTSTGGPKALQALLTRLPEDFPHPILIVQHMPKGFTKSLSERLDHLSRIKVKEAEDGELIKKGVAYIAPGGYHLTIRKIGTSVAIQLEHKALVNGHRPSVDVLFQSIASQRIKRAVAIVMTGMGQDGKKGLIELHDAVPLTVLAESEATSVVFGMPKAVIESGLVDEVKDLDQIAQTLLKYC